MTKQVPLGADRRDAIADAAIHLVATQGLRGLTHRAVDTEAGLPPGSTSYYLRTRSALLTACVQRMFERDQSFRGPAEAAGLGPAEVLTELVLTIARDRTDDLIARYALSLEASRQPDLRETIVAAGRRLRTELAELLTALGIADAEQVAWPVAAMLDGLLYDRVAGTGSVLDAEAFETGVRRAVAALLSGLTSEPVPARPPTAPGRPDRDS